MDAPDSPMTDDSSQSNGALLSPPGSQGADTVANTRQTRSMPINSTSANTNGKRPLDHISNGVDLAIGDAERSTRPITSTSRPGSSDAPAANLTPQTHAKSGYRWERPEDAPGYGWLNKKAQDEYARAWDVLVHKELAINGRYGDPIELAEQEHVQQASLQSS